MAALDFDLQGQLVSLYRSDDGGATWSAVPNTAGRWRGLWCDPSGAKWIASMYDDEFNDLQGWLWKSVDSGISFAKIPGTNIEPWGDAACDASATKCVAGSGASESPIYVSDDGFQTITAVTNSPLGLSLGVAMSADGEKVLVSQFETDDGPRGPGLIWYSGDGGQTFHRTNAPPAYYDGVSCDAAFKTCAAAPGGNYFQATPMVTSCDGGRTWSEDPGVEAYWEGTYVTADGGKMYSVPCCYDELLPRAVYTYPRSSA